MEEEDEIDLTGPDAIDLIIRKYRLTNIELYGAGKTAQIFRAVTRNRTTVIARITPYRFSVNIGAREWKARQDRYTFLNTHPFFARIIAWGVISKDTAIAVPPTRKVQYNCNARYELMAYVPSNPIPHTERALFSLYAFLCEFWSHGFTHGDLTLSNIRLTSYGRWVLIDLDTVEYNSMARRVGFPFESPALFYNGGAGYRDHNNFRIMIDTIPQWKASVDANLFVLLEKPKPKRGDRKRKLG